MTASPSVQIFYKKQNCKLCQQKCTIRTKTVACISSEASEGRGDNIKRLCISKSFLGSNGVLRWLGGNINLGKSQESSTPIWEKSAQVRANEDDLQARKIFFPQNNMVENFMLDKKRKIQKHAYLGKVSPGQAQ